jgi:DNA polymerase III delta prime subunit
MIHWLITGITVTYRACWIIEFITKKLKYIPDRLKDEIARIALDYLIKQYKLDMIAELVVLGAVLALGIKLNRN